MNRNLEEISDGKIYELNDMVRAACNDCMGCHACCEDMGESIILDPLDVWQLGRGLGVTFEQLLKDKIELHIVDGLILPNLKMNDATNCCAFLNDAGRCSIHSFRPGICRLFPLGRIYEEDKLTYFLQQDGCKKENCSKVKVSKWLDTAELKRNQKYLIDWHSFRKQMKEIVAAEQDDNTIKTITMFLLNTFYVNPYNIEIDFYEQFYARMNKIKNALNL